jgi:hypothetical protein
VICLLFGYALAPAVVEASPVLYVSPGRNGDDKKSGATSETPLRTITAAISKIPKEGTIQLLDGEYPDEVLTVDGKTLVIRAATDAHPRLKSLSITATATGLDLNGIEVRGESTIIGDSKTNFTFRNLTCGGATVIKGGESLVIEDSHWTRGAAVIKNFGNRPAKGEDSRPAVRLERSWSVDSPAAGISITDCPGTIAINTCLVARAGKEGLLIDRTSGAVIDFVTLSDNAGYALSALRGSVKIRNSILNSKTGRLRQGTAIDSQYNLYSSGDPAEYGDQDLIGEPKFGLALTGGDLENYRPLTGSPALNAASPDATGGTDLLGKAGKVRRDLGCIQVTRHG